MLNYYWSEKSPDQGVCVAHALTVGLKWSEHNNVPDCFPRRISLLLQFCPPPTRIRVSLAVACLLPSTVIEQLRETTRQIMGWDNISSWGLWLFSQTPPNPTRRTPHADERSLATKRQKVIKGSSRLRVCQLIPSHNPLTSILSLSPASSPSCPEPPSSRQEIYLDNSQDFIYPMVVQINDHDGEWIINTGECSDVWKIGNATNR
jgi:hypothetical protein